VPEARFLRGDLHRLPVAVGAVDVVVCGPALVHGSLTRFPGHLF